MEIDHETEGTMRDTATSRYGYAPQAMFAATLAGAERRAREAAAENRWQACSPQHLFRRLTARLTASLS